MKFEVLKFTFNCSRLTIPTPKEKKRERKRQSRAKCLRGGERPCPSSSIVGRDPMRTAEPPQIHSEADEGVKGVMMVDLPPHQPHKKKKSSYYSSKQVQKTCEFWL